MAQSVELIQLVCIRCKTPLPAEPNEAAWVCAQCGQGMRLDEDKGLVEQFVNFAAGIPNGARGKPFWVADGSVALQRDTYSGNQSREAELFWSQPKRFYVPAYALPLDTLLATGTDYLLKPPVVQPGSPTSFEPVILPVEDVRSTVEFIIMAVEAGRKDMLKNVQFSLQLSDPVLWVLP
jgi:hypothetical protein